MPQHQMFDGSSAEDCRSEDRRSAVPESGAVPASPCAACGASERILLGDSLVSPGASNVCCARCGLLQVTGADAAPSRAYVEAVEPGSDPAAASERGAVRRRAERLALALDVRMADAVLALGLRDISLLTEFDELFGVEGYVVAAHPEQCLPEGSPFRLFAGPITDFRPDTKFDRVLAAGVLERQHDVLGTLLHLRRLMNPGARLLIETKNVLPAGEIAEAAFFGANTAVCLSPNTLGLLLARAGFLVDQMSAAATITVVAKLDPKARVLPRPFDASLLSAPEQDGQWLVSRLASYVQLQQLRDAARRGLLQTEHLRDVLALLDVAAFEGHRVDCLVDIVQSLAGSGAGTGARLIASSAAMNAHLPREVRDGFARFAAALA